MVMGKDGSYRKPRRMPKISMDYTNKNITSSNRMNLDMLKMPGLRGRDISGRRIISPNQGQTGTIRVQRMR